MKTNIQMILILFFSIQSVNAQVEKNVPYGEVIEERFDIANIRIGSRDADRKGKTSYSAPIGYRILGHKIYRSGHHSGTTAISTTQPGELSYSNEALVNLDNTVRQGFISGTLKSDSKRKEGNAALNYAKFKRKFYAKYKFVANTNAKITFSWFVDSKSYDHGAKNVSYAIVRLEKVATSEDAYRAADIIKFAIESKESSNVFDLMKVALNADFEEGTKPKEGDSNDKKNNEE